MGRMHKSGLDYFPLDTKMDDEIELIESEHGIKGFGVLVKLYQKIYGSNYWINWDKKTRIMFSNRINVDIIEIDAIINSCIEWGIFNEKIYKKHEILTSTGIQKRYFEIIKRRQKVDILKECLLVDYSQYLDIDKIDVNIYGIDADNNSQSKVKEKESKPKEIKKKTYSNEFELCWIIVPKRNGVREGKKKSSEYFEKLSIDDKRTCYNGLRNYADVCSKTDKIPKDFERFIKHRIFEDYQDKIKIEPTNTNGPKNELPPELR